MTDGKKAAVTVTPEDCLEPHPSTDLRPTLSRDSQITLSSQRANPNDNNYQQKWYQKLGRVSKKFLGFLGPGIMVAVAYQDPGNYSTDVGGGAQFQFKMLFVILLSTVIALYLQTAAIKLGTATGKDLAENCHDHFHKYVSWFVWLLAEAAIMATDVAEVAGTAIALKVLLKVPLMAGVFITIVDILLVMLVYGRETGIKAIRVLEIIVAVLVMVVVVCFSVILGKIPKADVGHVFKGYIPSSAIVSSSGIYTSAGILGATVMPHSLYLGSAQVITRVREFDIRHGYTPDKEDKELTQYKPSIQAIDATMRYSIAELCLALVTVAFFANSAILVVAGDTLYPPSGDDTGDLFGLYHVLIKYLGKAPAVIFYVALLASGLSAGIICTMAGQIVSEGHIKWKTKPWMRRLVTRVITMIPCIVVVACMGEKGITDALNASQVVLTITLPFLATPLVWLTSRKNVMKVNASRYANGTLETQEVAKNYAYGLIGKALGCLICVFIVVTNVYNLVELGQHGIN